MQNFAEIFWSNESVKLKKNRYHAKRPFGASLRSSIDHRMQRRSTWGYCNLYFLTQRNFFYSGYKTRVKIISKRCVNVKAGEWLRRNFVVHNFVKISQTFLNSGPPGTSFRSLCEPDRVSEDHLADLRTLENYRVVQTGRSQQVGPCGPIFLEQMAPGL